QRVDATGDRRMPAQGIENGPGDVGWRKEQGGLDAGKSANQAIAPALIPEEGPEEAPGCHAQTSNPTVCKREKRETASRARAARSPYSTTRPWSRIRMSSARCTLARRWATMIPLRPRR